MDGKQDYQITDGTFGRALYKDTTALDALLDYFADRERGRIRGQITVEGETASVTVDGVTFTATPHLGTVVPVD